MIARQVVSKVNSSKVSFINPIGAVIKNSDRQRSRSLVSVDVCDSASLQLASEKLVALGYDKVKYRITTDCTGSGVNDQAYSPSFNYTTVSEALCHVVRNSYLAKGDISRYFPNFPLAEDARDMFGFKLDGDLYRYNMIPFGLTSAPRYCSTWSAEFNQWFEAAGINSSFMVDDYFLARFSEALARQDMATIASILKDCGLSMEETKFGFGQQLTFLGILVDTVSMTIRIDPIQAGGFAMQLEDYKIMLTSTGHLSESILEHTAGKLGWFCEVIQSGRLRIKWIFAYLNRVSRVSSTVVDGTLSELDWWINILRLWASGDDYGGQYPILSGTELLANPHLIELCQSDASGTDGFGYVSSTLDSIDFNWMSKRWSISEGLPISSHHAEVKALRAFLFGSDHHGIQLIIWITDSESGCYSINRANCSDPNTYPILVEIYNRCDELKCQLLALWVPREFNNLTDHLSHLAYVLCRDSVSGVSSFRESA
jgi:hypothetical protein